MFNRHLKVSVVKDDKKQSTTQDIKTSVKELAETISAEAHKTGAKVMCGMLLYIAADTARKVLIIKANK